MESHGLCSALPGAVLPHQGSLLVAQHARDGHAAPLAAGVLQVAVDLQAESTCVNQSKKVVEGCVNHVGFTQPNRSLSDRSKSLGRNGSTCQISL